MMFKNFFEVARVIVCAFVAVGLVKLTEWGNRSRAVNEQSRHLCDWDIFTTRNGPRMSRYRLVNIEKDQSASFTENLGGTVRVFRYNSIESNEEFMTADSTFDINVARIIWSELEDKHETLSPKFSEVSCTFTA